MTTKQPDHGFDCLAYKQQAQARVRARVESLSPDLELAYYQRSLGDNPAAASWTRFRQASASEESVQAAAQEAGEEPRNRR